ncbi:MAG: hypothetical protein CME72_09155 [Halomonadaceae bacterium]|nr:hypothetical protein [Halomonadaceae bacterium]
MFEEYRHQLREEALAAYPEEAVWLITPGECRRVANIADDPCATFHVAKREMAAAHARGLLAVVHSHPDFPACPSEADMLGQLATGVPWGIVATDGETATAPVWWGDGVDVAPLIGRGFRHGITDCYALIRDWYRIERGVVLPEYPRDWEWWLKGEDFYRTRFKEAGFRKIEQEEARPGDLWVSQLRSPVPNHAGILLENGLALHHPAAEHPVDAQRISRREPIARWQHHIVLWLRHESA